MLVRRACAASPLPLWEIQPVREWPDYEGGSFYEACCDADSLSPDNTEALGPVMFGVYVRHPWPTPHAACLVATHVRDFATYEEAAAFVECVAARP